MTTLFVQLYCRQIMDNTLSVVGRISTQTLLPLNSEMGYACSLEKNAQGYLFDFNSDGGHPLAIDSGSSIHLGLSDLLEQAYWPRPPSENAIPTFAIGSLFLRAVRPCQGDFPYRYVVAGNWALPQALLDAEKKYLWLHGLLDTERIGALSVRHFDADPAQELSMCKALSKPQIWNKIVNQTQR